jgi:hypothetical protein
VTALIAFLLAWALVGTALTIWLGASIRLGDRRDHALELPEQCTCHGTGPHCPECRAEEA